MPGGKWGDLDSLTHRRSERLSLSYLPSFSSRQMIFSGCAQRKLSISEVCILSVMLAQRSFVFFFWRFRQTGAEMGENPRFWEDNTSWIHGPQVPSFCRSVIST